VFLLTRVKEVFDKTGRNDSRDDGRSLDDRIHDHLAALIRSSCSALRVQRVLA